jgi:hypothetical protein
MKYASLFALIILLTCQLKAQPNTSVKLSPEMKEPSSTTIKDFIGSDENAYYVLRTSVRKSISEDMAGGTNQDLALESYDHNLKLIKMADLEAVVNGDKASVNHIVWLNGDIIATITQDDKKADQVKLYYQLVDKKTLLLKGSPQLLSAVSYDKNSDVRFAYDVARDKNSMVIAISKPDEKKTKESYKLIVYDAGMKKKWEKEVTLPYESKLFDKEDVLLDNQGNIYLRGRLYDEVAKEKRNGTVNYTYKILAYRDNGTSSKEYDLSFPNEFITDLGFNITDDGKLAVAGFYSDKGTDSFKGIVFMLVDPVTGEATKKGKKEFDPKFLTLFDRKSLKKNDAELLRYDLDNIIVRSDGGAVMLAEQYWVNVVTSTTTDASGRMSTRTTYYYHYHDIIAVNVNPDLSISWATKIPKRQSTANDYGYYSSYAYAVAGDKIEIIYNDNPDNLTITDPAKVADYSGVKKSVAVQVQISPDGKWKKTLLFSNKEQGEILRPKICEQSSANEMFLYAEKGKDYVVGKLTF